MKQEVTLRVIAHIETAFPTKFGIPRQSGLVPGLRGTVVFEPEYRSPDALRGLEGYSHLWLIWQFSEQFRGGSAARGWSPTVRPPRLGGNRRIGVFATRSPNRPNPIGLSSVEIESVEYTADRGPLIHVRGADLMDGTPILDIKPYLPFTDSHPDARDGFAGERAGYALSVSDPRGALELLSPAMQEEVRALLSGDPRPSYQSDSQREYGMEYGGYEIRFTADDDTHTLFVCEVVQTKGTAAKKP